MRSLRFAVIVTLLAGPATARADGCKYSFTGRIVPEREQRALIEWADGFETLYVAARSDPTAEGTVWIVPIRATAADVRAEPVDEFPTVTHYETVADKARRRLFTAVGIVAIMDSGGLCCPFFVGGCAGSPAAAAEVSRVERLGMIVTVISADSRAAIEKYLDDQGVNRSAADLSPLNPYFGPGGNAFVCGWVAKRSEPATANGLKVTFPAPNVWFPLRPTRAYTGPVETVVYVRGFVQPAAGCELPGLACQTIFGHVEAKGIGQAFDLGRAEAEEFIRRQGRFSKFEQMTRVTLTTDPQQWDRDLELVSGSDRRTDVAMAVLGWLGFLGPLWSALLGASLGLMLPLATIPRAERRKIDWLAGVLTGAAIALTLWASAIVFVIWRAIRFRGRPRPPGGVRALLVLAVVHLMVAAFVCFKLAHWLGPGE
jgi:hypothetical protein